MPPRKHRPAPPDSLRSRKRANASPPLSPEEQAKQNAIAEAFAAMQARSRKYAEDAASRPIPSTTTINTDIGQRITTGDRKGRVGYRPRTLHTATATTLWLALHITDLSGRHLVSAHRWLPGTSPEIITIEEFGNLPYPDSPDWSTHYSRDEKIIGIDKLGELRVATDSQDTSVIKGKDKNQFGLPHYSLRNSPAEPEDLFDTTAPIDEIATYPVIFNERLQMVTDLILSGELIRGIRGRQ